MSRANSAPVPRFSSSVDMTKFLQRDPSIYSRPELVELGNPGTAGARAQCLTAKQRAFVCAYVQLGGSNATRAAILAGYSDRAAGAGAAVAACKLLRRPEVLAAIQAEAESGELAALFTLGLVKEAASRACARARGLATRQVDADERHTELA